MTKTIAAATLGLCATVAACATRAPGPAQRYEVSPAPDGLGPPRPDASVPTADKEAGPAAAPTHEALPRRMSDDEVAVLAANLRQLAWMMISPDASARLRHALVPVQAPPGWRNAATRSPPNTTLAYWLDGDEPSSLSVDLHQGVAIGALVARFGPYQIVEDEPIQHLEEPELLAFAPLANAGSRAVELRAEIPHPQVVSSRATSRRLWLVLR